MPVVCRDKQSDDTNKHIKSHSTWCYPCEDYQMTGQTEKAKLIMEPEMSTQCINVLLQTKIRFTFLPMAPLRDMVCTGLNNEEDCDILLAKDIADNIS